MLVQKSDGSAIAADGSIVSAQTQIANGLLTPTQRSLGRLIEYWRSKPIMAGLISDYVSEIQAFNTAAWGVITSRLFPLATGVQLDQIGAIVGEVRAGLGDTDFRARINARIRINRSFGTASDVIAVIKLIETAPFTFTEFFPAQIVVEFTAPTTIAASVLADLLNQTRAAGVGLQVLDQVQASGFLLGDSASGGTADAAHGLGDTAGTTGGYLAGDY